MLAHSAKNLTLNKIIHAVDENIQAHGCIPSIKKACTGKADLCLTHNLWGALENHIEDFLVSVTVHDVISGNLNDNGLGSIKLFILHEIINSSQVKFKLTLSVKYRPLFAVNSFGVSFD